MKLLTTPSHEDAVLYNFLGIKQRKNLIFKNAVYRKQYISGIQHKQKLVKCYFNQLEKHAYSLPVYNTVIILENNSTLYRHKREIVNRRDYDSVTWYST
jgi:hypothetical protein